MLFVNNSQEIHVAHLLIHFPPKMLASMVVPKFSSLVLNVLP